MADRERLVNHPHLFYQNETVQKADLLKEGRPGTLYTGTTSQLVALILELLDAGFFWEITMVQTGHHDDGVRGHAGGNGCDGWPLNSAKAGDWMTAPSPQFDKFLEAVGASKWSYQEGMVGDGSDLPEDFHYAEKGFICKGAYTPGVSVFQDGGGSHIHLGANGF